MMRLNAYAIRCAMATAGLSARKVSAAAGLSPSRFSELLRSRLCLPATAGRIAKALGVSVEQITVEEES